MGKGKEEVGKLIEYLQGYVVTYFRDEEELQQKYGYPDYLKHKEMHERFLKEVTELKKTLEQSGSSLLLIMDINKKVIDWLVNHIGKVDKELGKFILEKQQAS